MDGFGEKTKPILRQKLNAVLAKFVKRPEDFGEFCSAIMAIDTSSVDMDDELQAELLEALEKLQTLTSPKKTKGDSTGAYQGLALLYAVAILQLYNEEPDAVEILNDLKQCYEKIFSKQKVDDGDVSALLVEILLAMVARPSSLMRQAAERVFEGFTSLMSPTALALLTDTLAANEDAEGLRALFDTDADMEDVEEASGSDEDEDEDEDDESELGSDVEFVDMEDAEEADGQPGSEDEDQDEAEDGDQESDEEGEDGDDKYKALDDALANLLKSHRLDKDKDAASDDDDDSDMSDSEMMELDDKISAAFKMRMHDTTKKKEARGAKETVVKFKHRALDLLAIFARKEAASPLAYKILLPLLQLMRTTKARDLAKKAGTIIAELPKAQKKARVGKEGQGQGEDLAVDVDVVVDVDELTELLGEIHGEMLRDDSHAYAKAASTASLLVVNSILAEDVGRFQSIWNEYGGLAMQWATSGGFQFSTIITDWTNWVQSHPTLVAKRMPKESTKED